MNATVQANAGLWPQIKAWFERRPTETALRALPPRARELLCEPCPCCAGQVRHLPGRDSGSTAEALFECQSCGHREHRGGWMSETLFEPAPPRA